MNPQYRVESIGFIWTFRFSLGISYNQPKFSSCAAWNSTAITFADSSIVYSTPFGVFVDRNNTVYFATYFYQRISVWTGGSLNPTRNIAATLGRTYGIFVTNTGDIYFDDGMDHYQINRWSSNGANFAPVMYVNNSCCGVFIDTNNSLYCSLESGHRVIKRSLNSSTNAAVIAAGTGVRGSTSSGLSSPQGIFIDIYFNLYVADCDNNRIQRFQWNSYNGTTLVGNGASGTINLQCPSGVVLDADGYLFIVDSYGHRIIGSGPNGYRCLVACSGMGSTSTQLAYPRTLSFDSHGNMFVTDWNNARIQKFFLASNLTCSKSRRVVSHTFSSMLSRT